MRRVISGSLSQRRTERHGESFLVSPQSAFCCGAVKRLTNWSDSP